MDFCFSVTKIVRITTSLGDIKRCLRFNKLASVQINHRICKCEQMILVIPVNLVVGQKASNVFNDRFAFSVVTKLLHFAQKHQHRFIQLGKLLFFFVSVRFLSFAVEKLLTLHTICSQLRHKGLIKEINQNRVLLVASFPKNPIVII